ncbi:MAG: protein-disulfide reductase DsbD domain-containing protein, partial [Myxococcota bacterium]
MTIVFVVIAEHGQAIEDAKASSSLLSSTSLPTELPTEAVGKAVFEGETAQIEARLVVSSDSAPQVGVLFDLAAGWHIYWRNPGDTGLAASLNIEATGYRVGPIAWPAPEVFEEADGLFTTYGYQDRVLLSVPLEAVTNASQAELISANPRVLVCRTECVPASFSLASPIDASLP